MYEYKMLVPIGAQLPQTEKLIQVNEKGDDGKDIPTTVMVSSIRSITWGTKEDKVAGVFVDFWGAPWPPILLPDDVRRRKRKHVVAYDWDTGLVKTCFNSDDMLEEVPDGSCPVCAKCETMEQATKGGDVEQ